jgi:hypothetical protein
MEYTAEHNARFPWGVSLHSIGLLYEAQDQSQLAEYLHSPEQTKHADIAA